MDHFVRSGHPPRPAVVPRLAGTALVAALAVVATTCHLADLVKPGRVSTLSVAVTQLEDSAQAGSTTPRLRSIILGASPDPVRWSVRPLLGSPWVRPSSTSGMAPDTLTVALDPNGLTSGVHEDTLIFTDASPTGTSIRVPVTFRVTGCFVTDVQTEVQLTDSLRSTDCGAPHRSGSYARLYRFSANANDSLSLWLSSTALDGYLVLDSGSAQSGAPALAENDACHAGGRDACLIYVRIPQTGSYVVEVTSAGAGATGVYTLLIAPPRAPAAPDTLRQFASDLVTPVPAGGTVGQDTIVLRAFVVDPDSDSVRVEAEVEPLGTPFGDTATATGALAPSLSQALAIDTGLANYTSFRWQARAVDRTGRASAWVPFGAGAADFQVVASQPPVVPTALAQLKTDGTTAIGVGGITDQSTVLFRALVADPDVGDQLRLEVEVQPVGMAFTDVATGSSPPVAQGSVATATLAGLADNVAYHWQARAVDQTGRAGPWASFGGNAESASDFAIVLAPSQLAVVTQPTITVAGSPITPAVQVAAKDALGNTLASFTGTVMVSLGANPAGATLSGTRSVAAVAGVATFADLKLDKVGTGYTLAFSAGALATTSAAFEITPGAENQLAFLVQPSNVSAGATITPAVQVQVLDAFGNRVTGSTAAVAIALTNPNGATLGGTLTRNAAAGVATFPDLTVDRAASGYTLTATSGTLASATSAPFTVGAGTVYHLAFTTPPPATVTAGAGFGFAVSVLDSLNNVATGYSGAVTVALATNPGSGTLTGTATVGVSAGVASFSAMSIDKAGVGYTLSATSSGAASGTSAAFNVTAAAASQIAVNAGNNQSAPVGTAVAVAPSVIVRDAFNNVVSGVSVTFAVATGGGTVVPTTPVATGTNGVAAATSWTLGTTAGPNTLTATAAGLTGSPVTFAATGTAGGATQIAVNAGNNQSAPAGTAVATPPSVIVRDANNNPVSGVSVTFAVASGGGTVVPTAPVATGANGVAAVTSWTLGALAGPNTLTATATGLTGSPVTFTATGTVGTATQIAVNAGNNQSATVATAVATPPSVIVRDAFNNPVSGVSVTFAVASGGGTVVPTTAVTTNASGIAAVTSWTLGPTAGSNTLTATSAGLTGSPVTFTATGTAGPATQIVFTQQPPNTTAGAPFGVVVTARDSHGNTATSFTGTDTLAIGTNPGSGTLSGTTMVAATAGVATFSGLSINKAGTGYTLTAKSGTFTATSNAFNILAVGLVSAAQSTVAAAPTTITASTGSSASTITVTAKDSLGNPLSGITVSILASGSGNTINQPAGPTDASGVATGTFASTGVGAHTISANVGGVIPTQQPVVTVNAPLVVTQAVASKALTVNTAYTAFTPVTASAGTTPYTFSINPALPAGMTLSTTTGQISGTPTATLTTTTFTVTVTDAASATGSAQFQLTVNPALVVTQAVASKTLDVSQTYAAFAPVTASGGTTPYAYALSGGTLPAGMSFSTTTGQISGTPSATLTTTTFTVTVTDAATATGSATFSLTVNSALVVTQAVPTTTLTVNTAYTPFTPVTASGGTTAYTFALSGGTLPAGMSFSTTTGQISGTPTALLATTVFTVTVTDGAAATGSATFSLTVSQSPTISLSPTSVTFTAGVGGSNPAAQTVAVSNTGTGTLSGLAIGTITYGGGASGWLAASVSPTTAPATVTLTPTLGSLVAGTYTATVPVTSSASGVTNSPQNIAVTFTVTQAPTIGLSPTSVTFTAGVGGSNPAAQTVAVSNTGTGTLSGLAIGTITYGGGASGWLAASVSPATAPATVTLTPTLGSLVAGTYTATVPVTSSASGVTNSPQNIAVTFTVTQAPTIGLSPTSVTFTAGVGGSNPAAQTVAVSNTGTGTLSGLAIGTITYGGGASGWLAASVSPTTAPATVTLTPTLGSLVAGTYTATVPVTSSASGVTNSPQNIAVTFTVTQAPTIALNPTSVTFAAGVGGSNPAAQTVAVSNTGTGTLSGLAIGTITYGGGASGWLAASVSPATAPATVTLTPTLGSLVAGTYTATVPVTSSASGVTNSPQNIAVTFTVTQAPVIGLSPTSVPFTGTYGGSSPTPQTVSVTNVGTGTLSGLALGTITYGASEPTGWLGASLAGTTAPTTVTLTPTLGSLGAGTYHATVPVTSSESGVTPQNITVTFTVNQASQTITFAQPASPATYGTSFAVAPTASSGLAVTVTPSGGCTIASNTVTMTSGTTACVLTASQAGDANYSAATDVARTVNAAKAAQTITFTQPASPATYGTSFAVAPTASSGLAVTVTPSGGCTIASNTVTMTSGTTACVLTASQAGNADYAAATDVARTVNAAKAAQATVTISVPGSMTVGQTGQSAVAGGGSGTGAYSYATSTPTVCDVNASTGAITASAAGTCTLTATRATDANYLVATSAPASFPVTAPTIGLNPTSVTFTASGSDPTPQTVDVTNTGTGTLSGLALGTITYGASEPTGWLGASIAGATAPTTVTLTPTLGSLAAGTYHATVEVTSSAGGVTNSPQTITVTFTVQ